MSKLIALLPGEELNEQRVSAMNPVMRYVVQLTKPAQVIFDVKESNTASRTALYLSQVEEMPSAKNASWSCESSKPRKTVVLLPIDERFRVGACYLSVCYTGTSGVSFFSLRVTMKEHYVARWAFTASMSVYEGSWKLDRRSGQHGRCIYYDDPKRFEQAVAASNGPGAAATSSSNSTMISKNNQNQAEEDQSTLDAVSAATESIDTQVRLLAQSYLGPTGAAKPLPKVAAAKKDEEEHDGDDEDDQQHQEEVYEGEWLDGEKDGEGVYFWPAKDASSPEMRYDGHWRAGQRSGKGILTVSDPETGAIISRFTGEWRGDNKYGFGVEEYFDGSEPVAETSTSTSKYEGMWEDNERHGTGVFTYADGTRLSATWSRDEIMMPVKADYANGESYSGEWKDNRRHGKGVLREAGENAGLIYEGSFVDGLREGSGVWRLRRGVDFRGVWVADERQSGEFSYPSSDIYQGDWDSVNHMRTGHGICCYKDNTMYRGEWQNDKRHGNGELTLPSGEKYVGQFYEDMRHGQGTCTFVDEDDAGTYSGAWKNDERHGYGEHLYADGVTYHGEWERGHYHGTGRMDNPIEKWSYSGQWSRDVRHGMGVVTVTVDSGESQGGGGAEHPVTESYRGYWKENKREGEGTIHYSTGEVFTGDWKDNTRADGRGTLIANGTRYEGEFRSEKPHGKGILTFESDGSRYDGHFSHGLQHGEGTFYDVTGDVIVGRWERGRKVEGPGWKIIYGNGNVYEGETKTIGGKLRPHGEGTLTYLDGTCFEGRTWVNGEYKL